MSKPKRLKQRFAHKETEDELMDADRAYHKMSKKKPVHYKMKKFKGR